MTAGLGDPLTEHGTVAPVVLLKTTRLGGSATNFGLEISGAVTTAARHAPKARAKPTILNMDEASILRLAKDDVFIIIKPSCLKTALRALRLS